MSTTRSPSLKDFLDKHRADASDWNLTGMAKQDMGKYKVEESEYDEFLTLVHRHIFGTPARASSLLERHREAGPLLVDLDFRYEMGGPLVRRFTVDHVHMFIAEYVAAMIYFSKVESLTNDLYFYSLVKPAAETDKSNQKDGIHIQCPSLTTEPKYQYGIRGFLLERDVIRKVFGETEVSNPAEDCFDVSVIHRNNWFLYGACKQDKAQYRIHRVWKVAIDDIREALDGGDPTNFEEIVDIVKELMTDVDIPPNSVETMKLLSIRCGHETVTPLPKRDCRAKEWEELMIHWGAGKAKKDKEAPKPTNDIVEGDELVVVRPLADDVMSLPDSTPMEDIQLAYRIVKECLDAERRAAEYQDWINVAICLKNIANNDDSFQAWVDLTRRVNPSHKKATKTDAELRTKWNLVRIGGDCRKLTIASLIRWAEEDNPKRLEEIRGETDVEWIINFGTDTHVNVAKFVRRMYKHDFRCSVGAQRGRYEWYYYPKGEHSWKHLKTSNELRHRLSAEVKNKYMEAVKILANRHNHPANLDNEAERDRISDMIKKIIKIQRELEMTMFKEHTMKECQEQFYDEEFIGKLNTNPFLVGVANGVLDLNYYDSGDAMVGTPRVNFRKGLPDDNISFQMGRSDPDLEPISYYPYDPEDPIQSEILKFFTKIYPDESLRTFVLTLLSSCLEGQNKEQKFYVNQGGGSNGKSMIQILMEYTFGDYQTSLQTTVVTRKRPESGAANPDLITTKCKRYMYMGEPDSGEKLNTSCMKQISGEDRIQARGLFSDQEKFTMMGKLFMSCNDLPPVANMDNGTWRRIRVIPHTSTFKDPGDPSIDPSRHIYEKDFHLKTKLRAWRTGFLSLLVHYYETRYLVHGLKEPPVVTSASDRYKEVNDMFSVFFDEHFVKEAGAGAITAKTVKTLFRDWKKNYGRGVDLKESDCLVRMATECGNNSTEKEFYGVRRRLEEEDDDISMP